MKITKKYLQKIVEEEVKQILNESNETFINWQSSLEQLTSFSNMFERAAAKGHPADGVEKLFNTREAGPFAEKFITFINLSKILEAELDAKAKKPVGMP